MLTNIGEIPYNQKEEIVSNINPLNPVIALTNGIDSQIVTAVTAYLLSKPNIATPFGNNINPYNKNDLSSLSLPAIIIYPQSSKTNSSSYWSTGAVKVEIIFPVNLVRANKLQSAMNVGNAIYLQIKQDALDFLSQSVFGLIHFGMESSIDYGSLYASYENDCKIVMTFTYDVDMTRYWNTLVSLGYDLSSPDVVIYEELQDIEITIKQLQDTTI